jgi:hypothetical protein
VREIHYFEPTSTVFFVVERNAKPSFAPMKDFPEFSHRVLFDTASLPSDTVVVLRRKRLP